MEFKAVSWTALVVLLSLSVSEAQVKTCTSPLDYFTSIVTALPTTCVQDPIGYATPTQILRSWGYTVEETRLFTEDGYEFLIIRVYKTITSDTPIIMTHGIYTNPRSFLSMKNVTLVVNLIENGYDVYLICFRGTIYTTVNRNGLTTNDYAFFDYSFHELGIYEVCQALDWVFTKTNKKAIVIGYSMGTTAIFVCASLNPTTFADKAKGIVALAPVAILNTSIRSILGKLAPIWPAIQPFAKAIFNGYILKRNEAFIKWCTTNPITLLICYSIKVPIFGDDYQNLDFATRPINEANNPDGVAEKVITHFSQIICTGIFQQFDNGPSKNNVTYLQPKPPAYPLGDIITPTIMVVGPNDFLAETSTSLLTFKSLSLQAQCDFVEVPDRSFAHDGFIAAVRQYAVAYGPLLPKIAALANGVCA